MYTIKTIPEILDEKSCLYSQYSLCYIDDIPDIIFDYTPESKKIINDPDFSWEEEKKMFGSPSCRLETGEFANPEYIPGESEMYAYFSSVPFSDTWGDDWDDAPYEHNAGSPYDSIYSKDRKRVEIEILKVPFAVPSGMSVKQPKDWSRSGNSSFSVENINFGVIPWISVFDYSKRPLQPTLIFAGINPYKFIYELSNITKL